MNYEKAIKIDEDEHCCGLASSFKVLKAAGDDADDHNIDGKVCCKDHDPTAKSDNYHRKTYIWDDFHEDQNMLLSSDLNVISSIDPSLFAVVGETKEYENGDKEALIKQKIKDMKNEHDLKVEQVIQLKTALARKKVAADRKLKLIKQDWEKRFEHQKRQHDMKEKELIELISQTKNSIDVCIRTKENLSHELQNIESSRKAMCNKLEEKGKEELLKLQHMWKRDEYKRLTSIAKQKTTDLKKLAAKALEPELRRIVQEHRDALQRKREEIELDIKATKEERKLRNTEMLAKKKRDMEAEELTIMQSTDEENENKIIELKKEHEKEVEATQRKVQDELKAAEESCKALLQEKERIFKEQLRDQQNYIQSQRNEAEIAFEVKVNELQMKRDQEVRTLAEKQQDELEQWKSSRLPVLVNEFINLELSKEKELEAKAMDDLEMVNEKVQAEFESKKRALLSEYEAAVDSFKRSLEQDIEIELQRGKKLEEEHDIAVKDREVTIVALNELKLRLNSATEKYHDLENLVKAETERFKNSESMFKNKQLIEEHNGKAQISMKKECVKSLEAEVTTLKEKVDQRKDEYEREIKALVRANEKELSVADSKIRRILDKKEDEINRKQRELTCLQGKVEELDLQLSAVRQQQILYPDKND